MKAFILVESLNENFKDFHNFFCLVLRYSVHFADHTGFTQVVIDRLRENVVAIKREQQMN